MLTHIVAWLKTKLILFTPDTNLKSIISKHRIQTAFSYKGNLGSPVGKTLLYNCKGRGLESRSANTHRLRVQTKFNILYSDANLTSIIGFLGQFRKMSSQFNHHPILFRTKSNATKKRSFDFILRLVKSTFTSFGLTK